MNLGIDYYLSIIFVFLIAAIICLILTPAVRLFSLKFNILKSPNGRTVHHRPMPLMGGLGIFFAFFFSILLLYLMKIRSFHLYYYTKFFPIFIGAIIIIFVGILDDIKGVSPKGKLFAQTLAAIILWSSNIRLDIVTTYLKKDWGIINDISSLIFTLFWIVAFTNAINLIDGLDGLATGISAIAFLSLGVVSIINKHADMVQAYICFALAGAAIAFLKYNFNPAKIFLGDTGSLFLGFMLGSISIAGAMKSATVGSIMVPIVLMGIPVLDTSLSIIRRILKNSNIFEADREHIHHKLIDMGFSHRRVVLILYVVSLIFAFVALYISFSNGQHIGFVVLVFSVAGYFALNKLGYKEYLKFLRYRNGKGGLAFEMEYFSLVSRLNLAKTPEAVWEHATKILEIIGFERASLHLLDGQRKKLSTLFKWSIKPDIIRGIMSEYEKITRDQPLGTKGSIASYQLAQENPSIIVVKDKEDMRGKISDDILDKIAADQFVSIPLIGASGILGALIADKYFSNTNINEEEIALATSLSSHISVVIERNSLLNLERKEIELSDEEIKLKERKTEDRTIH
ncbi:MAG: hypothetical protein D6734_00650 [Candidatus Schekmanbacteria bacterium]|nr:MAG: hypothetical protein D6734_00650 [Candidatus Schekmanbacteria bacterium]